MRQPCTTPQKFTPITHSQAANGPNHGSDGGGDAGVVADEVDAAESLQRRRGERLDVGLLADVGANGEHLDAVAGDRLLGRRERRLLDVGEDEVHPGAGEALRQGQTRCRWRRR